MNEPVKIVIILEGGMVAEVCTLGVPVEALVINYDTDGAGESKITQISQGDGSYSDAYVSHEEVQVLHPEVAADIQHLWPGKLGDPS